VPAVADRRQEDAGGVVGEEGEAGAEGLEEEEVLEGATFYTA